MEPNSLLFTDESQKVAQQAATVAFNHFHNHITREHVLLAFFEVQGASITHLFSYLKIDINKAHERLEFLVTNRLPRIPKNNRRNDKFTISVDVKRVIDNAQLEISQLGEKMISSEIIFYSLVKSYFSGIDADKTLQDILLGLGLDEDNVRKALLNKSFWEK